MKVSESRTRYALKVMAAWLLVVPTLLAFSVVLTPPMRETEAVSEWLPIAEIGLEPVGAGLLALVMIFAAAMAMLIHGVIGGRVRWWSTGLVSAGVAAALWHLPSSSEDGYFGSLWIAGAAVGLAAYHVGEDATVRRWITTGLGAMLCVWLLQGIWYVQVEHPMTVEKFQSNMEAVLLSQGIEPGTSAQELYQRRMMDVSFIGRVGFSNVMGGVVAAVAVLVFAGVAVTLSDSGLTLRKGSRRLSGLGLGLAVAGLYTVWLTQSRGAMAAAILVMAWVLMAAVWDQKRRLGTGAALMGKVLGVVAVGLVGLAVIVIVIRGGVVGPPETVQGERSLMFRWWYWVGAFGVMMDAGLGALGGVGVFGFQDAFPRLKPGMLPEDVTSTHNVWVDWLVMLGVGGLGFVAVTVSWLFQGVRGWCWRMPEPVAMADPWGLKIRLYVAAAFALSLFGMQFWIEQSKMYSWTVMLWVLGLGLFIAILTWVTGLRSRSIVDRGMVLGVVAAGLVLMVHGQIEMTFFQPGSVGLVWLMIGLCGASGRSFQRTSPQAQGSKQAGLAVVVAMLILVVAVGLLWVVRASDATVSQTEASKLRERVWAVSPMVAELSEIDRLLELRPHALLDHARAGWVYETRGDRRRAAAAYRRALAISEAMYLDPAQMLETRYRQDIERRLSRLENTAQPDRK